MPLGKQMPLGNAQMPLGNALGKCTNALGKSMNLSLLPLSQLAAAVEYTNCISAKEHDFPNECPDYDTKQSVSEVPVILELWEMWSTLSLPLLPGQLWPGMVAPDLWVK